MADTYFKLDQSGEQIQTDLNKVESLANVATTGSYNDLKNKPTINTVSVSSTGTSTKEAKYMTVDGTEWKLAGSGGGGGGGAVNDVQVNGATVLDTSTGIANIQNALLALDIEEKEFEHWAEEDKTNYFYIKNVGDWDSTTNGFVEGNQLVFYIQANGSFAKYPNLYYKIDDGDWTLLAQNDTTANRSNYVYIPYKSRMFIKGTNQYINSGTTTGQDANTILVKTMGWNSSTASSGAEPFYICGGNMMSWLSETCSRVDVPAACFSWLFYGQHFCLRMPRLPAYVVFDYGYYQMFTSCSIIYPPVLWAEGETEAVYQYLGVYALTYLCAGASYYPWVEMPSSNDNFWCCQTYTGTLPTDWYNYPPIKVVTACYSKYSSADIGFYDYTSEYSEDWGCPGANITFKFTEIDNDGNVLTEGTGYASQGFLASNRPLSTEDM